MSDMYDPYGATPTPPPPPTPPPSGGGFFGSISKGTAALIVGGIVLGAAGGSLITYAAKGDGGGDKSATISPVDSPSPSDDTSPSPDLSPSPTDLPSASASASASPSATPTPSGSPSASASPCPTVAAGASPKACPSASPSAGASASASGSPSPSASPVPSGPACGAADVSLTLFTDSNTYSQAEPVSISTTASYTKSCVIVGGGTLVVTTADHKQVWNAGCDVVTAGAACVPPGGVGVVQPKGRTVTQTKSWNQIVSTDANKAPVYAGGAKDYLVRYTLAGKYVEARVHVNLAPDCTDGPVMTLGADRTGTYAPGDTVTFTGTGTNKADTTCDVIPAGLPSFTITGPANKAVLSGCLVDGVATPAGSCKVAPYGVGRVVAPSGGAVPVQTTALGVTTTKFQTTWKLPSDLPDGQYVVTWSPMQPPTPAYTGSTTITVKH